MKNTLRLATLGSALFLLAGCAASSHNGAEDKYGTNVASAKQCQVCTSHGVNGKTGFEWFKGLCGKDGKQSRWVAHHKDKDGKDQELALNFKVVSNGSAVCETLFPGKGEEMITMYHLDNGALTATHYCAMGNQPRMQATVCACDPAKKTCDFNFLDGTNMDASKDSFMGKQEYIFTGPDTLVIKWHHLGPGGVDAPETFGGEFKRVK